MSDSFPMNDDEACACDDDEDIQEGIQSEINNAEEMIETTDFNNEIYDTSSVADSTVPESNDSSHEALSYGHELLDPQELKETNLKDFIYANSPPVDDTSAPNPFTAAFLKDTNAKIGATETKGQSQPTYIAIGSPAKLDEIKRGMETLNLNMVHQGPAKTHEEAVRKHFEFWDTQPVPKIDEIIRNNVNEAIVEYPFDEVRKEPLSLPPNYEWNTLDIDNPIVLNELYHFLCENYNDNNKLLLDYSPEFLRWVLQPPGWEKKWHCALRYAKNQKLIGFISAVPANVSIYKMKRKIVQINFLCVLKKHRSKRVCIVLIREITRRVKLEGIFQAVYTAGVVLPKPIGTCRYHHYFIQPRKLIEINFLELRKNMTMKQTLKLYKLPKNTTTPGFRTLEPKDVKQALKLLSKYLIKFDLAATFNEEEFRYWFLPRPDIVNSFVVEKNGKITDFVSFYALPSKIMQHPVHKGLKAAYAFYYFNNETPLTNLMQDVLVEAKNLGFELFNALDIMENRHFIERLRFGPSNDNLQYYLFNWRCQPMSPNQIGLVLQ